MSQDNNIYQCQDCFSEFSAQELEDHCTTARNPCPACLTGTLTEMDPKVPGTIDGGPLFAQVADGLVNFLRA